MSEEEEVRKLLPRKDLKRCCAKRRLMFQQMTDEGDSNQAQKVSELGKTGSRVIKRAIN